MPSRSAITGLSGAAWRPLRVVAAVLSRYGPGRLHAVAHVEPAVRRLHGDVATSAAPAAHLAEPDLRASRHAGLQPELRLRASACGGCATGTDFKASTSRPGGRPGSAASMVQHGGAAPLHRHLRALMVSARPPSCPATAWPRTTPRHDLLTARSRGSGPTSIARDEPWSATAPKPPPRPAPRQRTWSSPAASALPGHEIEVRDAAGKALGERRIGRVFFRGPSGHARAISASRN